MREGAAIRFNDDAADGAAAATADDYDDAVMVIGEWRGVLAGAPIFRGVAISGPTQCGMVEILPGYVLHRCRTEMGSILDSSLFADGREVHCIGASTVSPKNPARKSRAELTRKKKKKK